MEQLYGIWFPAIWYWDFILLLWEYLVRSLLQTCLWKHVVNVAFLQKHSWSWPLLLISSHIIIVYLPQYKLNGVRSSIASNATCGPLIVNKNSEDYFCTFESWFKCFYLWFVSIWHSQCGCRPIFFLSMSCTHNMLYPYESKLWELIFSYLM